MNTASDMFPLPEDGFSIDAAAEALRDVPEKNWPPLLVNMVAVIEARFKRKGMSDDAAFAEAVEIVMLLANYFGGRNVYLPKGELLRTAMRDLKLWRRYCVKETAEMVRELAGDIGVSDIHMYAILARQRELHLRKIQGRLFPD